MSHSSRYDDIVVGAGVIGLAHAYELARRGRRVAVLERSPAAAGASVRNFGMLWPIGQPFGEPRTLANRSLDTWRKVLTAAGLRFDDCGSLHLAYREDEAQVLREYARLSVDAGEPVELLARSRVAERSRPSKREGLRAALWSPAEACIDPRAVIAGLPAWLHRELARPFRFGAAVTAVRPARGPRPAARPGAPAASGSARATTSRPSIPEELAAAGMVRCKLQMMRTQPIGAAGGWARCSPRGLTLRHYRSFEGLPDPPGAPGAGRPRVALVRPPRHPRPGLPERRRAS